MQEGPFSCPASVMWDTTYMTNKVDQLHEIIEVALLHHGHMEDVQGHTVTPCSLAIEVEDALDQAGIRVDG